MSDIEYTELSSPLCSESGSKSSHGKRTAAKLIVGISGLVIFGYLMSTINFSSPEANFINLNSSEANHKVYAPVKVVQIIHNGEAFSFPATSKDNSLLAFSTFQRKIEVWDIKRKEKYAVLRMMQVRLFSLLMASI